MANNWTNINERLNILDKENKNVREWISLRLIDEYLADLTARMEGKGDDAFENENMAYLSLLSKHEITIILVDFISKTILPTLSLYTLLTMGNGKYLRGYIENYATDKMIHRLREIADKQNNKVFCKALDAEPSMSEDEYWDEYNYIYDKLFESLGGIRDAFGTYHFNEFNLLERVNNDNFEASIRSAQNFIGNDYFEREYQVGVRFLVKAHSEEDAKRIMCQFIKNYQQQEKDLLSISECLIM